MNLTVWPFTILSIAALYAGGKGLFSGFEMIEQWTGVRSGHNPVASMMLASQASRMVGGMAKSAKQNIGKGLQAVSPSQQKKNRESAQNLANRHPLGLENANTQDHTLDGAADQNGNTGKVATFASGLGRVAGAAKNPSQLAKSTGQAALSGAKSTGLAALNRAKSSVKKQLMGLRTTLVAYKMVTKVVNRQSTPLIGVTHRSMPIALWNKLTLITTKQIVRMMCLVKLELVLNVRKMAIVLMKTIQMNIQTQRQFLALLQPQSQQVIRNI
ncbi:hypothetical protein ACG92U_02970 [Leuconostoc citreum]